MTNEDMAFKFANKNADEAAFARPVATAARDDIRAAIAALLKDC